MHAERRADTVRIFRRMRELAEDDPERARLRDGVIEEHMPYARHIAARYAGPGGQVEDLVQVAYLGLVKSAHNFDPDYGTSFLGYATTMIIGEVRRYFRDATWDVHVPRRMQELSVGMRKATELLTHDLGRSPTVAELARELDATVEEMTEALGASEAYNVASLDRPMGEEEDRDALGAMIGRPDARFDAVVDREALKPLLAKLAERDKRILMMRFFRGMTQNEIAAEIGVSQMQISRLITRILKDLRAGLG
jgi:RNA polymerase sigma-B factor